MDHFYEINNYFLKPFQGEMKENPILLYNFIIKTFRNSLTSKDFKEFSIHLEPIEKSEIEQLYMNDIEQFVTQLLTIYYYYLEMIGFDMEEIAEEIYDPLKEKILSCLKKGLVN